MPEDRADRRVSRRQFLKTVALTTGGIAVSSSLLQACATSEGPTPTSTPPVPNATAAPPPSPAAAAPVAADQRAANLKALYEAAKKEGEVIYEEDNPPEILQPVIDAFQAEYPGIRVSLLRLVAPTVPARLITEASQGRVSIDVANGSMADYLQPLVERDLLLKYDWSSVAEVGQDTILLNGTLLRQTSLVPVIGYNTKLVAPNEVPKTWEDLLDPKWKGKIMLSSIGNLPGSLFWSWDEKKVMDYLTALRKLDLTFVDAPKLVGPRIASGEAALGEVFVHHFLLVKDTGAPVDFAPIGPVIEGPSGLYTTKVAPHPNAAKLLMAWFISPRGREVSAKAGRAMLASPCSASRVAQVICEKNIKLIPIDTPEKAKLRTGYETRAAEALGAKLAP